MTSSEALPHNLPDDSLEPEYEPVARDPAEPQAPTPPAGADGEDAARDDAPSASGGVAPAAEPAPAESAQPQQGFRPVYWTPPPQEAAPPDTPPPDPGFQPVYWTPPTPAATPASPEATAPDPQPAPHEPPADTTQGATTPAAAEQTEPPAHASPEATTTASEPAPAEPPEPPEPVAREQPDAAAAAAGADGSVSATSAEIERLRLEIAHRDQMLLTARERRLGLEREIGRLERQLDVAIEAQREAATERAELRRLLGNVQLQVQSLLQLPPPSGEYEEVEGVADAAPHADEPVAQPRAQRPAPRTAESIIYAPPAGSSELPTTDVPAEQPPRRAPAQRRGLAADARGVLSNLRRLF